MSVTVAQKLFEKYLMLARAGEESLTVMVARDDDEQPHVVVGYIAEGGNFTPLAILLTASVTAQLTPDFEASEKCATQFERARAGTTGRTPSDFGTGIVNQFFSPEAIAAMELDND